MCFVCRGSREFEWLFRQLSHLNNKTNSISDFWFYSSCPVPVPVPASMYVCKFSPHQFQGGSIPILGPSGFVFYKM